MFASHQQHLAKSSFQQMIRFRLYFIECEGNAQNWIIARESAVTAVVNAFIRKRKRREQAHRSPKVLQCQRARGPSHRLKRSVRLRSDQLLKTSQGG